MTPEVQYGIVATLSAMIFVVAIVLIFVVLRDLKNRVLKYRQGLKFSSHPNRPSG